MYMYGKPNNHEECECGKAMNYKEWKKDDQLDDIVDLLKKILKEKQDKKEDKKETHKDPEFDVVTVTFDLDDHQVEFVSPANGVFGCPITVNVTSITDATRCLLNQGYKIVTYVAAFEASELGGDTALGTYTFVRRR
ncbi:MAG TPA: hypothetical protein VNR38_19505 [Ureibacillus sp.]|nr:hypothetical protein [Ureibacillus sp.]